MAVGAVRCISAEGPGLPDVMQEVLAEAARHGTRVGVVGGAGRSSTVQGGPSLIEQAHIPDPEEPRAAEGMGRARLLETMRRRRTGFTVAH